MLSHEKYIGIEVVNVDGEDGQIYKLNYYHQANISKETFDAMQEENLKHSNTVIQLLMRMGHTESIKNRYFPFNKLEKSKFGDIIKNERN